MIFILNNRDFSNNHKGSSARRLKAWKQSLLKHRHSTVALGGICCLEPFHLSRFPKLLLHKLG
jgi:hypothetical protein